MNSALIAASLIWVASGAFLIIYTQGAKRFFTRLFLREQARWFAAIPLAFGAVFIVGAFLRKDAFWLLFTLGLLSAAKAVYLLAAPPSRIRALWEWWSNRAKDETVRLFGLIAFTLGGLILSNLMR